jgi:FtsP/CotA-like multicopper oxidase with cupredoxin domain
MSARKLIKPSLLLLVCAVMALVVPTSALTLPPPPIGVWCETGTTFDLETDTGYAIFPDGNSVFMWSFRLDTDAFQFPGPVLCVNEGDTITVNLTNNLPEPVSIIFPGQTGVTTSGGSPGLFTAEAAASGGTVSYTFVAEEPGTYLYESGTSPQKQIEMGLFGVLIVRPSLGASYAYNDSATEFDLAKEYLLVIHEIDPELHAAVENGTTYDWTTRHARYWTINGRAFPDSIAPNNVPWLPSQPYSAVVQVEAADPGSPGLPALIRYANAGTDNHPFHPHGNFLRVIARDGRLLASTAPVGPLSGSMEAFTKTIGSGQTYDLQFWWLDVEPWTAPGAPDVPVLLPGLQNLVFKDDLTFYSGDPELGETGDFLPGVTVLNQCGEYYFPWHTHALNEFQNFDEGFGGLATAVRVDPPGGCAP